MRSPALLGAAAALLVVLVVLAAAFLIVPDFAPDVPQPPGTTPSLLPAPSAVSGPHGSGVGAGGSTGGGAVPSTLPGPSGSGAPPSAPPIGVRAGDRAPSLVLPRLGGGTVDLAALRGRPVWVNFIATWCPDCWDELPIMEVYATQLGDRLPIVLVDVHESPAVVAAFAGRMRLTLPIGLDQTGAVQQAWSAYALPVHVWLDAGGIVRAVGYGELGPPQFLESVRRVLPGASLTP